ncbi:PP2C family protein-serine/threonine phosphatase [Streptomyces sp. NPDC059142]|uniref:PP2C family protein-serine/threonine phosphatase n=1 Tax=Streptomyces sp. NPDC059142 TaxID=3346739 RepID=UPI0036B2EAE4
MGEAGADMLREDRSEGRSRTGSGARPDTGPGAAPAAGPATGRGRGRGAKAGPRTGARTSPPTGHPATGGDLSTPVVLGVLPFAALAVVALVELIAGPRVGFLPLFSLGPAFAGLVGGWRRTAFIGALALVCCLTLGLYDGLVQSRRGYTALGSVAGATAASLVAVVMRQRREAELASVRSIAEVAQRALLRPVPPTAGPLRAAVSYTSAVAEARIGGDLYEVAVGEDRVRVIVGDVQGKGLEAVETVAVVLGAFREAAHDEPELTRVGARVERAMSRELDGEKFVTALIAEFGGDGGAVFLNYGHPPPMLVRADGAVEFPEPDQYALPLGLEAHGTEGPRPFRAEFAPGDQLLLYTDGVTEARDAAGTFYPLGERARLLAHPDPATALEALRRDLVRHVAGPLHDDAATLLLRYAPERRGTRERPPELGGPVPS